MPAVEAVESALVERFTSDFQQDKIDLPIIPDVALRVRRAVNNPDVTYAELARIVQIDVTIASRLIRLANSPVYKAAAKVERLDEAVRRIGFSGVSNLVNSLTMAQLFSTRHSALKTRMNALWRHSTRVAAISYVLAGLVKDIDPNKALLAGLVHDIGVVSILAYADNYPDLVGDEQRLDSFIEGFKGQAGAMLLDRWDFDPVFGSVAVNAENWQYDTLDSRASLCDLVIIAQIHSMAGTPAFSALPRVNQLPAFAKLNLGNLGPDESLQMLSDANEEIRAAIALLR